MGERFKQALHQEVMWMVNITWKDDQYFSLLGKWYKNHKEITRSQKWLKLRKGKEEERNWICQGLVKTEREMNSHILPEGM